MTRQTLVEKIIQRYSSGLEPNQKVKSGDMVMIQPTHILTHDNTGAVIPKFRRMGGKKIFNPKQPVFALDHNIQDTSKQTREKYQTIESFAQKMLVDFYPAGWGIGHQIMIEEGYVWPGILVVASDSHANMYSGLGCLGTPVVRTDAAAIWATGKTWWQIPPIARVILIGKLQPDVTGKDVILSLCSLFNQDEVLNHAVEFTGEGVASLGIEERLTIANMTTEWGALTGLFPIDEITLQWVRDRVYKKERQIFHTIPSHYDQEVHPRLNQKRLMSLESELRCGLLSGDHEARYSIELELDLNRVIPQVAGPHHVKICHSAFELQKQKIRIDKGYLVSCVNSRTTDLSVAARILKGKKVAKHVSFYISAASKEVQEESEKRGDWQLLLESGAIALPPGCGPCIGLGQGLLQEGEVGISCTNRNFKGRMGSKNTEVYLGSPAVVAQSVISGIIDLPSSIKIGFKEPGAKVIKKHEKAPFPKKVNILSGFPETIEGELVFCYQDNLNTDGIYPGKYTYLDNFTPQQQAAVAMENYDPDFQNLVHQGDLLVGGFNFGTGSSREQAATALKYKGLQCVLAGSFSQTYKRNAINNGFLTIELPELVSNLKSQFGEEKLTIRTGLIGKLDIRKSSLNIKDKAFFSQPIGLLAQELILSHGMENWIKKELNHGKV